MGNSTYAKGPFTNMSNTSSKYTRIQNSVPRAFDANQPDQMSAGRGSRAGGAMSRSKYFDIDKKNLPSLPIYQILRAFNLQQYTLKLAEKGYGSDVYKLALLTAQGRDDLVEQLKALPGHRAKLAGFFAVIDQIYPRQTVIEQIKAVTPTHRGGYKGKRITSARMQQTLNQVGPQKTLLQKYDQLDEDTKKQFNEHFLSTLDKAVRGHQSLTQFIQQSTGVNQANATKAMSEIFPPQFYTYGDNVVNAMNGREVANEVEDLVTKFTKGTKYQLQQQEIRLQKELAAAKHDIEQINKEVMQNLQKNERAKSNQIAVRKNSSLKQGALAAMQQVQVEVDDDEPTMPEGVEGSLDAVDLPIVTTASLTVGEGLAASKPLGGVDESVQKSIKVERNKFTAVNQAQKKVEAELEVDSDDLPIDDDDEEILYEEEKERANLIEESQTMDLEMINILDDPRALSMTLRNQYDQVCKKNQVLRQQEKDCLEANQSAREGAIELPQQSLESVPESQVFNLLPDETTDESRIEPVADAEQSKGAADGILWPSQAQDSQMTASSQQAKAKTDSKNNRTEKEAAMAAKRAKFDQMFPVSQQMQQKLAAAQQPPKEKKWDPLIAKEERDAAWNCGHSLDSKKVTSALGYLDLKQICYCLAQALMKHIEFSQGFFFLGDLQEYHKRKKMEESNEPIDKIKNEELEFTYNLGDKFRIDIEAAKKRKEDREKESQKNFEELKKQMEESAKLTTPVVQGSQKLQSSEVRHKPPAEEGEDEEDKIEDEVGDSFKEDEDGIEDFYGDDTFKDHPKGQSNKAKKAVEGDAAEEGTDFDADVQDDDDDLDLDYSQTHLEDFLRSQTSSSLMKGSNIQSGQLLNSFLSTYNKLKGTGGSSFQATGTNDYPNNALGTRKASASKPLAEIIPENDQESIATEKKDLNEIDSDEELDRSEEDVNLKTVSGYSNRSSSQKQKVAILSPEEVKKIQDEVDASEDQSKYEEDAIKLNMKTQQGALEAIKFKMRVFDHAYNFMSDQMDEYDEAFIDQPTLEELYYYCKYVIISGRMEKEIPILCLIYLERFFTMTGILMTGRNWKRLTLIALILASKIWDDDSLENVHFPQVMSDITVKEIAGIEAVFLAMIDFSLNIRGAEYAKYYFILKTFAEKFNSTLPMGPLAIEEMSKLQNNTVKAESDLREKYNMKLSLKKSI